MKYRFRSILLVADGGQATVHGFAILLHAPDLNFCYFDYICAGRGQTGRGIGGALYEHVREEALQLAVVGIFLECLPDDPALSPDTAIRKQNAARLKFFEQDGARPLANTAYETPLTEGAADPPYLVFDNLGQKPGLSRDKTRNIVAAVLERKCNPQFLVLAFGLDTAKGDPTGSFLLTAMDFRENGRMIGALNLPILVVQEGGYKKQTLGINARNFFTGFWERMSGKSGAVTR